HDSPLRQKEVRSNMRILNVVRIKVYSRYGDFKDLNLLLLQGHLDHLFGSDKRMLSTAVKLWTRNLVIRQRVEDFQLGIESYQTQLNLTKPGWDATGYEFKHDYTIIESPRALMFTSQGIQDQTAQSGYEYAFLDSKGCDKEQRVTTLAPTYVTPTENSLLAKTGYMTNFLNWYCRQVNKTKITQADLEGQAYEVVKAFYLDVIHLQFQMEECHKLLTDQVDWTNPEGDQVRIDVNRPLPLGGPPGHVTIQS
nr:hypothetical protein [Tanacetum cinerariifolium]